MIQKNLLLFTFIFFIILSFVTYQKLAIENTNLANSYVEFETDRNLTINLTKGVYFVYTINRPNDHLEYDIVNVSDKKTTFEFISSEKKGGFRIGPKSSTKITINDNVYKTIGRFVIEKDTQVLFDFKNFDNEITHLAYQNDTDTNFSSIFIYYYALIFCIIASLIVGIIILVKRFKNAT